jgi:hypothetical protein
VETTGRQKIQIILLILLVAAGIRLLLIYRERHEAVKSNVPTENQPVSEDAYVVPKKLHAYDLKSARELVGKPVWIKAGYGIAYYPFNEAGRRCDFRKEAGLLGPIQELHITDIVLCLTPSGANLMVGSPGAQVHVHGQLDAVMSIFSDNGKSYAFAIGTKLGDDYSFTADDEFYLQDPKQLYSFWPQAVWQAIQQHQVQPGMNELQTSFAVGVPSGVNDNGAEKTVEYANNGHRLRVTFDNGKATNVSAEQSTAEKQ